MLNTEIDITEFFNSCYPKYYSASVAEIGENAGRITWENAVDRADETGILDSEEKREAFRVFVESSGGWTMDEIRAWNNQELEALLIQWISGDMREGGLSANTTYEQWREYESLCEQGQVSGRLYGGPLSNTGRVYFSID